MTNRIGNVTLARVAKIYLAAGQKGLPPTKAVREHFGLAQSTAGYWVAKARNANLLPPMGAGSNGSRNAKALRVAKALGVDYDALVRAVKRHANGDLRI
jgi:hypothetical protein